MKKHTLSAIIFLFTSLTLFAQKEVITFVGKDINSGKYIQLSRVEVTNQTQNWTETIYYPDTTITLTEGTGIEDYSQSAVLGLQQNLPNPFDGNTTVHLSLAKGGNLTMELSDITGRVILSRSFKSLQAGNHSFRMHVAAAGTYILTAHQNGQTASIKIINNGSHGLNSIEHTGFSEATADNHQNLCKGQLFRPFSYEDKLIYKGFATINGEEVASATVYREETTTETISLPFVIGDKFICGTSSAVDIDGNIYATTQIGEQCWMAENLRTTQYKDGKTIPVSTTTSMTEPYRHIPQGGIKNVATNGYLYNWAAVMNGAAASSANPSGIQGPCPEGWHMSSETEWHQMTDFVSASEGYRCNTADSASIAKAISSSTGWAKAQDPCAPGYHQESNNSTGLALTPSGCYVEKAGFLGSNGYYWTCSSGSVRASSYIFMCFGLSFPQYSGAVKNAGYSVRCIKN